MLLTRGSCVCGTYIWWWVNRHLHPGTHCTIRSFACDSRTMLVRHFITHASVPYMCVKAFITKPAYAPMWVFENICRCKPGCWTGAALDFRIGNHPQSARCAIWFGHVFSYSNSLILKSLVPAHLKELVPAVFFVACHVFKYLAVCFSMGLVPCLLICYANIWT